MDSLNWRFERDAEGRGMVTHPAPPRLRGLRPTHAGCRQGNRHMDCKPVVEKSSQSRYKSICRLIYIYINILIHLSMSLYMRSIAE